jgi:glycerophosphoryl diester phosphodiesterase
MHPFLQTLRPTLHIAHRGGAALAPENTVEAFRLALDRYHTDMIETDVHMTADGVLVLMHDATIDRTTEGTGVVADFTIDRLESLDAGYRFRSLTGEFTFRGRDVRIPRLETVLQLFPTTRFNIEIKDDRPGVEDAFAQIIRNAGAIDRVCVGSEDDEVSRRLLGALPEACHFYPRHAAAIFIAALRRGEPCENDPYEVLDIPLWFGETRLVDASLLAGALERNRWVNVWTVDERSEMEKLVADRVGGIMTDRPDRLRDVLG